MKASKSNFIKNLIPRSGSYDINNNSVNYDDSLQFKESLTSSGSSYGDDQSLEKSKKNFKSTQSILKLFTDSKKSQQHDSAFYATKNNNRKSFSQSKWTVLGVPLLYLTYFCAVYTFLAYGATTLLSVFYILKNFALVLIPLYILVVGYITITFLSFGLIFAIKKDRLNIITLWITALTTFVLPEIGLNIVLVESTWKWSYYDYKLIMVTLIVRICLNLPCLVIVLYYHISKVKHNKYLQDMLQPLKNNIVNGEVLKIYNNVKLDCFDEPKQVIQLSTQNKIRIDTPSGMTTLPLATTNETVVIKPNTYFYKFNKNQPISLKQSDRFQKYSNKNKCCNDEEALINVDDKNSIEYNKNALHLVWGQKAPDSQLDNEVFSEPQQAVEEQKVTPLYLKNDCETGAIELRIAIENHRRQFFAVPIINCPSGSSSSLEAKESDEHTDENLSLLRIEEEANVVSGIKTNPLFDNSGSTGSETRSSTSSLKRSLSLDCAKDYDNTKFEIPILHEVQVLKCSIRNDTPVSFQRIPIEQKLNSSEMVNEQYLAFKAISSNSKNKIINLSNHHLYLPPAPTIKEKAEENSTLIENTINSTTNTNPNNTNMVINTNETKSSESNSDDILKESSNLIETTGSKGVGK